MLKSHWSKNRGWQDAHIYHDNTFKMASFEATITESTGYEKWTKQMAILATCLNELRFCIAWGFSPKDHLPEGLVTGIHNRPNVRIGYWFVDKCCSAFGYAPSFALPVTLSLLVTVPNLILHMQKRESPVKSKAKPSKPKMPNKTSNWNWRQGSHMQQRGTHCQCSKVEYALG